MSNQEHQDELRRLQRRVDELEASRVSQEERRRLIFRNLPHKVFLKDEESRFVAVNEAFSAEAGVAPDELVGKSDLDLYPAEDAEKYRADDRRIMHSGKTETIVERHMIGTDERTVEVTKAPLINDNGEILGLLGVFVDITDRVKWENTLRASEQRHRLLTEGTQDAIVVVNDQGVVTLFNPAAEDAFGYMAEEVVGQMVTILMPSEHRDAHTQGLRRYVETRVPNVVGRTVELRGRRKNGEEFPLDLSLSALEQDGETVFLGAIRDTSERQLMQARLVQAEKVTSLALMSAGVAHEINNPLAYVANNLAVIERDLTNTLGLARQFMAALPDIASGRPDIGEHLQRIADEIDFPYVDENIGRIVASARDGVKRVATIVENLRSFSRVDRAHVDRVDIQGVIESSLELVRGRFERRGIEVSLNYETTLPRVLCEPAQLNQVFLNLLVNSMQAIESKGEGSGTISIRGRASREQVTVDVSDDGCGIPEEDVHHIFDPFFTTKDVGAGSGLGLSIAHGIVADHGGSLEVESTPGEGTRMRIVLPVEGKPEPS